MKNAKKHTPISWGTIIFWFVLFYPIAILLLVLRFIKEKDKYISNGKALKIISILIGSPSLLLFYLWLIGEWTYEDGTAISFGMFLFVCAFFVVPAMLLFKKGQQYITRGQIYDHYLGQLRQYQSIDINQLSAEIKVPYSRTCSDLQYMIDSGYIPNACIDHYTSRLVLIKPKYSDYLPNSRIVTCPHCCGNNTVRGEKHIICDYCDSPFEI